MNKLYQIRGCIIGGGAAGFYTAQKLFRLFEGKIDCRLDMIEKSNLPFGLVKYGVAPDHPEVKNVITTFDKIANHPGFQYFGNITIPSQVSLKELESLYSFIVLAYGSQKPRVLDIPGINHPMVISAREFVGWYNRDPLWRVSNNFLDHFNTKKIENLSVMIIGMGNVSIDCARMMLREPFVLKDYNVPLDYIEFIRKHPITSVNLFARRSIIDVAFTIKELRELTLLPNCQILFNQDDILELKEILSRNESKKDILERAKVRLYSFIVDIFEKSKENSKKEANATRSISFFFKHKPKEIINIVNSNEGKMNLNIKMKFSNDCLEPKEGSFLIQSIGQEGNSIDPDIIPFDQRKNCIPNDKGSIIVNEGDRLYNGYYCSGWIKRGATGVILSTLNDAFETAEKIFCDFKDGKLKCFDLDENPKEDLITILKKKNYQFVNNI